MSVSRVALVVRALPRSRVTAVGRRAARVTSRAFASDASTGDVAKLAELDAAYLKEQAASADTFAAPIAGSGKSFVIATDLFRVAQGNGTLDAVADDLVALSDALDEVSPFVRRVFQSSSYAAADCIAVLNWLMGDEEPAWAGTDEGTRNRVIEEEANLGMFTEARAAFADVSIGEETADMLVTLASQARLDLVGRTANHYMAMLKAMRNECDVRIVSAVELTDAQRSRAEAASSKHVPEGKTPAFTYDVDPSVMGGLLVHVENSTVDLSAQSLLRDMNEVMAEATV